LSEDTTTEGNNGVLLAGGAARPPSPPIRLDACLDNQAPDLRAARLVEPLPYLFITLVRCVATAQPAAAPGRPGAADSLSMVATVRALLDRVAVRLSKCEPEEYDLDKNTDYSHATGLHNLIRASLLLGCYEARRAPQPQLLMLCQSNRFLASLRWGRASRRPWTACSKPCPRRGRRWPKHSWRCSSGTAPSLACSRAPAARVRQQQRGATDGRFG